MPVEMAPPTSFSNLPQIQPPRSDDNLLQIAQQGQALSQAKQLSPYQVQSAQQQVQAQQLDNQQKQLQMQSQQGLMKLYQSAGGNPTQMTAQAAAQNGVLPADYAALQKHFSDLAHTQAETNEATATAANTRLDYLHTQYAPIFAETDPVKQQAMLASTNASITARNPNVNASDLLQYTGPDTFAHAELAYTTHQWLTAQAAQIRAAAAGTQAGTTSDKQANEAGGQQADSAMKTRANVSAQLGAAPDPSTYDQIRDASGQAALFPPSRMVFSPNGAWLPGQQSAVQRVGMTAEQRTQADQAAANAAQNALPKTEPELALIVNDPSKPQALRDSASAALKTLTSAKIAARPVTNFNTVAPGLGTAAAGAPASGAALSGQAYLDSLPLGTSAQVKAIAEGRAAMPSGSTRSQAALQLRNAVFQYDPSYSDQRAQVRKAFTSGADGRNIGALNTAAVHLDQLGDAAGALSNGTFRPGNQLWNAVQTTFGGTAPTNFGSLKTAVAGEMASALKGNATDPEIAAINQSIVGSSSPAQLQGVVNTNLGVLGAKLQTYKERYQAQIPGDTVYSPVLPSAAAAFTKHAPAASAIPPMPSTLSASDVGKVYQSKTGQKLKITAVNPKDGTQFQSEVQK